MREDLADRRNEGPHRRPDGSADRVTGRWRTVSTLRRSTQLGGNRLGTGDAPP
jgi:hypothetical protein